MIFLLNEKIFLLMIFKRNISVGKDRKNKSHPLGFLQKGGKIFAFIQLTIEDQAIVFSLLRIPLG